MLLKIKPYIMSNLKNTKIEIAMKKINGTSIVAVNNYSNLQDEVSNQSVLVGFNYEKRLVKDLHSMLEYSTKKGLIELYKTEKKEVIKKAYKKMTTSLIKRTSSEEFKAELLASGDETIVRSEAQKKAYTTIAKGLKAKDEYIYIKGLLMSKTILEKGDYSNQKPLTEFMRVKKKIELIANQMKIKNFKIKNNENLSIKGFKI